MMRLLTLVVALLQFGVAAAATITVNTAADNRTAGDGQCTLREAIANVNAAADTTGGDCTAGSGAGDTITFSVTLPAIVRLTPAFGELAIAKDVAIVGPGAGSLAIDGRYKTRVFHIAAGSTSMSDLTIRKGRSASRDTAKGGGILVDSGATVELTNCTLHGNVVTGHGYDGDGYGGGGLYIDGTATLTNCTLSGNKATGYDGGLAYGGSIYVAGTATLTRCALDDNKAIGYSHAPGSAAGGGLYIDGSATLTNCTLNRNKAIGFGDGYWAVLISPSTR